MSDAGGPLTIGTAGHVDHGKTALVHALTGVDTDRLAQEKRRGLSIELGYAPLTLPSGRLVSVIDVPGHERFIETMVAGATGIDCFVLVIAATEGVRPQTEEHARILRALAVEAGIAVITKTDLASPAPAAEGARRLLPGAPVVVCPPAAAERSGPVLEALDRLVASLGSRSGAAGPAILHIDRCFTIAGAGTVVTGTLRSGAIRRGDTLTVHPRGLRVRVRGVQVHGADVAAGVGGQRVAVNLARVDRGAVARGDVLAADAALQPVYVLRARLAEGVAVPALVTVHHGTRATIARLTVTGPGDTVRLRCREPLMARAGEPLVLRDPAGRRTIGGAVVTTVGATRRRARVHPGAGASPELAAPPRPPPLRPPLSPAAAQLAARFAQAGRHAPSDAELDGAEHALLQELCVHGRLIALAHGRHAAPATVAAVRGEIEALLARGPATLGAVRDQLGVSRAQAKAFLDHLDSCGVTRRRADDARVLRSASALGAARERSPT